jgi:ribose/xylose/arabinose/galactoside ABC-type transport system permease subunit
MHNPILITTIAVYISVVHVGMFVGMSNTAKYYPAAVQDRRKWMALGAYGIALLVAGLFGWVHRHKYNVVTFWATLAIIIFGLSYAIYMAIPKHQENMPALPKELTTPDQQYEKQYQLYVVHLVAFVLTIITYFLCAHYMKPLSEEYKASHMAVRP